MSKENTKDVRVGRAFVAIPNYYTQVDSMPEDPEGSTPFMMHTDNSVCFVLLSPLNETQEMPHDKETIISGIREYMEENQGLIEVDATDDYAYTIVKTLKEPSGVQYILTFHKFLADGNVCIQGYFDEQGMTGIRDSMVYSVLKNENVVGCDEDPTEGWSKDPYDPNYKKGVLMNLSEQEVYDEQFPGFPLSMCREMVRTLKEN